MQQGGGGGREGGKSGGGKGGGDGVGGDRAAREYTSSKHPYHSPHPTPPRTVTRLYQVSGGRRFKRSFVSKAAVSLGPKRERAEDARPQRQRDNKTLFEAPSLCALLHLSALFTHKPQRLLCVYMGISHFYQFLSTPVTVSRSLIPSKTHPVNSKRG